MLGRKVLPGINERLLKREVNASYNEYLDVDKLWDKCELPDSAKREAQAWRGTAIEAEMEDECATLDVVRLSVQVRGHGYLVSGPALRAPVATGGIRRKQCVRLLRGMKIPVMEVSKCNEVIAVNTSHVKCLGKCTLEMEAFGRRGGGSTRKEWRRNCSVEQRPTRVHAQIVHI